MQTARPAFGLTNAVCLILVRDHRINGGAMEAFVVNVVYRTLMPNL